MRRLEPLIQTLRVQLVLARPAGQPRQRPIGGVHDGIADGALLHSLEPPLRTLCPLQHCLRHRAPALHEARVGGEQPRTHLRRAHALMPRRLHHRAPQREAVGKVHSDLQHGLVALVGGDDLAGGLSRLYCQAVSARGSRLRLQVDVGVGREREEHTG